MHIDNKVITELKKTYNSYTDEQLIVIMAEWVLHDNRHITAKQILHERKINNENINFKIQASIKWMTLIILIISFLTLLFIIIQFFFF